MFITTVKHLKGLFTDFNQGIRTRLQVKNAANFREAAKKVFFSGPATRGGGVKAWLLRKKVLFSKL